MLIKQKKHESEIYNFHRGTEDTMNLVVKALKQEICSNDIFLCSRSPVELNEKNMVPITRAAVGSFILEIYEVIV